MGGWTTPRHFRQQSSPSPEPVSCTSPLVRLWATGCRGGGHACCGLGPPGVTSRSWYMACKLACVGLTQPVSNRAAAAHSCAWNAHAGNYRISGKLSIARNVVLRGAGTARTTLTFVNSLSDLDGPRTDTNGAATAHAAQWLGDWHAALRCNTGTVCCISMMSKLPYTRQLMPRGWRAAACVPCRRERVQEQRGAAGLPRAQPLLSLHRTGQCHTGEGRAAPECAGHRLAAVHDAYHAPCGWPLRGADVFVPPPPPH